MDLLIEIFHDDDMEIVEISNYERRLYTIRVQIDQSDILGRSQF